MVSICTTSLTFNYSTLCPHSIFKCFGCVWDQRAINLTTALKYHPFYFLFLTLILTLYNKYISEFTLKSTKLSLCWLGCSLDKSGLVAYMGKRTFSFPICPFLLSHYASYPVHTGFAFMRENSCKTSKLTAHPHLMPL